MVTKAPRCTLSAVHFAYIAALSKDAKAESIAGMTPAEKAGYDAYLKRIADMEEEYEEYHLAETSQQPAALEQPFPVSYAAWSEQLDASLPLPQPEQDLEPDPDPAPPSGWDPAPAAPLDDVAIASLMEHLESRIQRIAYSLAATYRYARPRIEADDLAQMAKLEILETLQRYQRTGKVVADPIPYFYRVARNVMADFCNRYGSLIRSPLTHNGHGRFHPWKRVESLNAQLGDTTQTLEEVLPSTALLVA
jgi:DNA-directed RNA polymerase specialized sigma24 family protein